MRRDGLDILLENIPLVDIMRLIECTVRWVDPKTFRLLPVWFPEYARGEPFYKADWYEKQMNTNPHTGISSHKHESNRYANKALTEALGLLSRERTNWTFCHIWGVDDPLYQKRNLAVQDRRFYSCVGNMILLPAPLKTFTDVMPDVKIMLRVCARNLYGWYCDHDGLTESLVCVDSRMDWAAYPASWPREPDSRLPLGVVPLNDRIRANASRRLAKIKRDMALSGPYYPRTEVRRALAYWGLEV